MYRMIFHDPSVWRWNKSIPGSSFVVLRRSDPVTVEIHVSRTTASDPETRTSLIWSSYRKDFV